MRGGEIRVCNDCGYPFPLKAFAKTEGGKWRRNTCTKCKNIKNRYRITGAEFHKMLESQLYCCLICEDPINESTACVDHCHDDKLVRALLCNGCNSGIGQLKHDKEVVLRAAEYLAKYT